MAGMAQDRMSIITWVVILVSMSERIGIARLFVLQAIRT
jgi:hypothetical protein